MPQIVGEGAVPRAQVGGERDVRLLLSPTLFALVAATVTAALAAKGARAGRTEDLHLLLITLFYEHPPIAIVRHSLG